VANEIARRAIVNYEDSQPPLFYAMASLWWHAGKWFGFENGSLLYWIRFLNIFVMAALVWISFVVARLIFPKNQFLRISVPALIAFIPQTAFYSIQNDVFSPLCFGIALISLIKLSRTNQPDIGLGIATGLALAATYLTKISNLPLLAISITAIFWKIWRLHRARKLNAALLSLISLFLCLGLPILGWTIWSKYNFGDFTGSEAKIAVLGWTHKPLHTWWHHPIFTFHGLWIFISGLMATFWQGEIIWHHSALALTLVNFIYAILSVCLFVVTAVTLVLRFSSIIEPERWALYFIFSSVAASVVFLGFLSLVYDFQNCYYPSREHPYFTSGRLMLGALIPFMVLFGFGLDRILRRLNDSIKFCVLAAMIVFMLTGEIITDWPVFSSQYNWFHM
jgi:hypothetical protein